MNECTSAWRFKIRIKSKVIFKANIMDTRSGTNYNSHSVESVIIAGETCKRKVQKFEIIKKKNFL